MLAGSPHGPKTEKQLNVAADGQQKRKSGRHINLHFDVIFRFVDLIEPGSGLANALLQPPTTTASKGPSVHGSAKAELPTAHNDEPLMEHATKPAVEITGQQETGAPSKQSTAASMSYENLSDSDEGECSEAGAAGTERASSARERFDSTTPPMFYSFLTMPKLDDEGGSTPRSRLTSVTSLTHTSRCQELPKTEPEIGPGQTHSNAAAPQEQGTKAPPPSQCLYEPLSDDEND